jgi:Spy/CpxP family protein refolding chaperone
MAMRLAGLVLVSVFAAGRALAQDAPYAGFEARSIKALSAEQISDLRAGRGMDLALAAELNGYPGPMHVVELARDLRLTDEQTVRAAELTASMRKEAITLGERLIAAEADLEARFATKAIDDGSLAETVRRIGEIQAALRAAHLKYHLATKQLLTPEQVTAYAELRGYAGGGGARHHRRQH